jgi:hypothetical protein
MKQDMKCTVENFEYEQLKSFRKFHLYENFFDNFKKFVKFAKLSKRGWMRPHEVTLTSTQTIFSFQTSVPPEPLRARSCVCLTSVTGSDIGYNKPLKS